MEEKTKKTTNEVEGMNFKDFSSFQDAYDAGKKAGLIEGYNRASNNILITIPKLQESFLQTISEINESELTEGGNK